MNDFFRRMLNKYRKDGLISFLTRSISYLYNNYIWPYLPQTSIEYNGVTVLAGRWFDDIVPWRVPTHPHPENYEMALCTGIRKHVEEGETVVIVGGGWGVSSVIAARQVGPSGKIITYEGSREYAEHARKTVRGNGQEEWVSVRNAVVSKAVELKGESGPKTVDPGTIPTCDTLVLDCEGAEISILQALNELPPLIIVETHGRLGAPKDKIRGMLENRNYTVISCSPAEVGELESLMEQNGVYVLVAVHH